MDFDIPPKARKRTPTGLLDLSNELIALICSFAMVFELSSSEQRQASNSHPKGVIGDLLSKKLRQLLLPMRSCKRLYQAARRAFLESNTVVLDLADIRMGACRLEYQPTVGQLLYTGNPDPLLARLVHVQVAISVLDTRMRNSLAREAENLRAIAQSCYNVKTLHVFLKVDSWFAAETDLDIQSTLRHQLGEAEIKFMEHAEAVVEALREVRINTITVAFHEWIGDAEAIDAREFSSASVIDALLDTKRTTGPGAMLVRKMARVKSGGVRRATVGEKTLKLSWGASDDIRHVVTVS
jgi:hypothetical protein